MNVIPRSTVFVLAGLLFAGCQETGDRAGARNEAAPEAGRPEAEVPTSAGKPGAPIRIDYTIIGTPVVGQPVGISLEVSSALRNRPVTLNYRINDARNLRFPE